MSVEPYRVVSFPEKSLLSPEYDGEMLLLSCICTFLGFDGYSRKETTTHCDHASFLSCS